MNENLSRWAICFCLLIVTSLGLTQHVRAETSTEIPEGLFHSELAKTASQGLTFISQASQHGLSPEDYHYAELKALFKKDQSPGKLHFVTLYKTALTQLIHDLRVGRWVPLEVDSDWHIPPKQFDAAGFLRHAVLSGHFENNLALLAPNTSYYQALQAALARYQVYANNGGWTQIPRTPKLSLGQSHPHIHLIQQRLAVEDPFFALTHAVTSSLYDPLMNAAVKRFQKRYRLKVDGIIGPNTLRTLNRPVERHLAQLHINLERARWLPQDLGERYLFIQVAQYYLRAVDQGKEIFSMDVIVGTDERQTPSFSAQMNRLVFNPFWYVPSKLARLDLLPKQQRNPDYFFEQDIRVFDTSKGQRTEVDPMMVNWQVHDSDNPLPYLFRQDPGDKNALGRLKFLFDNPWQIYLHDTPGKSLFRKSNRAFSSGCIRVADPVKLAQFSLSGHSKQGSVVDRIESEQNQGLVLSDTLPLFVVYFTVSFDENGVLFWPDVYHRDQRMIKTIY